MRRYTRLGVVAAVVTLLAGIYSAGPVVADTVTATVGVGAAPADVAVNPVTNKIYVLNYESRSVTVIDGDTYATSTVAAGASPSAVAVNPVTNKIYVANVFSSSVTVIDGDTNATTTVATGYSPHALAVNPVTNKVYVTNHHGSSVTVIDGATNTTTTLGVGIGPIAVAINTVTNTIYVAAAGSDEVVAIDGVSNSLVTIGVGDNPVDVVVNEVTNKIYVANVNDNNVTVIDGATNTVTTVSSGTGPNEMAINTITNKVYVKNFMSGDVTVIDGATNITSLVATGKNPASVAVNEATNKIYVANGASDDVTVIHGATNTTSTVGVGDQPIALAVNEGTNKIYVANNESEDVTVIDGAITVTVNQRSGQADPTNELPILFDIVFSEPVLDFTSSDVRLSGNAGAKGVYLSGSGSRYTASVFDMEQDGLVVADVPAGAARDAAGHTNRWSTSTDNIVRYDRTGPSVTVDKAPSQGDPTDASSIVFDVVFSELVTGFGDGFMSPDVTLGGTAGANKFTVTGTGQRYQVSVSGMTSTGSVTASVAEGRAFDLAGNPNRPSAPATVQFTSPDDPAVEVERTTDPPSLPAPGGQVTFGVAVVNTGIHPVTITSISDNIYRNIDTRAGSTCGTALGTTLSPAATYRCSFIGTFTGVAGDSQTGTVTVRVTDAQGRTATGADASTVTLTTTPDTTGPTVTIDRAFGQPDPTSTSPITFTARFSEPVTGFVGSDVVLGGSAEATTAVVTDTGDGTTYTVAVSGMTSSGTVTTVLGSGAAVDAAGNPSSASTSVDNQVTYNLPDTTAPTVTIDQHAGQADPTTTSPVTFTAVFSEPVVGFDGPDVVLGGSAGATTAVVTDSGDGRTYTVAASGMTTSGTVTAGIGAGAATDGAGNPSRASESTDNQVTYDIKATPTLTIQASAGVPVGGSISATAALAGGASPTGTITLNLFGPGDSTCATTLFASVKAVTSDGAISGSFMATAPGTYRWVATYSGDDKNHAASSPCGTATVVVTKATPSISTTPSGSVPAGGQVSDSATVTGGFSPSGTVVFTLHGPGDTACTTPIATRTGTLNGGTASSGNVTAEAAGTYRWVATYSGDANNTSVTSPCGADTVLVTPQRLTGRAYGASANVSALFGLALVNVAPTPDTGFISTTSSSSTTTPCVAAVTGLMSAEALCVNVTTVAQPGSSTATATVAEAKLAPSGIPAITMRGVKATSTTTCTGSSGGATTIDHLAVGGIVVINRPTTVAPNTAVNLGAVKLVLNEQIPSSGADKGLTVNAVHATVNTFGLAKVNVAVASAQSGIGNCP